MKHLVLSLLLAFMAMVVFPNYSYAQDIPDDGEEIVIDPAHQSSETGPRRNPVIIPFSAYYYDALSCVEVFFQSNVGNVTIIVTNQYTANSASTQVSSSVSSVIIPIGLGSGLYSIEFVTQEGLSYIGVFLRN